MPIKPILREELENSLRMQAAYERELAKLPRGSLVRRSIRGHSYWYLVYREGQRVRSVYRGKIGREEIRKYQAAKKGRAKYRPLLSRVKKQIKFLRGVLRGKEPI